MIAFFFRTEYHRFFISNRCSAQEFGEVKKIAWRDSNPVPVDANVMRLLLHHRVKVN